MAQAGYTPISLYYSSTSGHIPTASDLVLGELGFNIADGIIYYLNPSNVVTAFGGSGGASLTANQTFTGQNTFTQGVVCTLGGGYSSLQNNSITVGNVQTGMNYSGGQLNWQINNSTVASLQSTGIFFSTGLNVTSTIDWNSYTIAAPTGNTTQFLRNDGTWAVPGGSGGGDVYLANNQTFTGDNTFTQGVVCTLGGGYSSLQNNSVTVGNIQTGMNYASGQLNWQINNSTVASLQSTGIFFSTGLNVTSTIDWNGYTIPAPTGSATTFLRNDGTWATPSGGGGASLTADQTFTGSNTFSQILNCTASGGYSGLGQNSVLLGNGTTGLYYNGSNGIGLQVNNTPMFGFYQSGAFGWNGYAIAAPSGSTSTYLRNDGTWDTPPTGGNVYLANNQTFTGNNTFTGVITSVAYNYTGSVSTYFSEGNIVNYNNGGTSALDSSGNFTITGAGYQPGGGSWTAVSDSRLKDNVTNLTGALSKITSLRPVQYTWKCVAAGEPTVGFIAQEVAQVLPNAVKTTTPTQAQKALIPDNKLLSVGFQNDMTAYLVAAIQELNATINTQAAQIAALQAKVGA
jgi:hypothetical protein